MAAAATNDLRRIRPGKAQYTLCCTESGGVIDDLIVYYVSDDELFLVPNAANTEEVVRRLRGKVQYVKPHGALYNVAVHNTEVARAIGEAVLQWNPAAPIFGLAGSPMLEVWRERLSDHK